MTTASAATASTVVARDSSGDFAANQITAASGVGAAAGFLGNASSADILKTARTITVDGVVDGSVSFNGSADVTITLLTTTQTSLHSPLWQVQVWLLELLLILTHNALCDRHSVLWYHYY